MYNPNDVGNFEPNHQLNQIDEAGNAIFSMTEENRINRIIFVVYLVISIMMSVATFVYGSLRFPNAQGIIDNIEFAETPSMSVVANPDDPTNPFTISVTGALLNANDMTIPSLYIEISFYDESEALIGSYTLSKEQVASGETWSFTDDIYSDVAPTSISYKTGIDETSFFYLIINFLQVFITAIIFLAVDKVNFKNDWQRFKKTFGYHIGQIVVGYILVYVALIVSQYILELLNVTSTSANENAIADMFSSDPLQLILLFLLLCVFTPIVEELVFRKAIYSFFQNKLGHLAGIIGSGLIFGLMHVIAYMDFIQSIPYIFMGLVFGYIYYQSKKNIYVTIGVHFINNFVAYVSYVMIIFGVSLF